MTGNESIFYYIDSLSSLQFYPDNQPFKFKNQLAEPIAVDDETNWEVCLHELHIKDDYEPRTLPDEKFFGHEDSDNKFVYIRNASAFVRMDRGNHTVMSWITEFNKLLKVIFTEAHVEIKIIVTGTGIDTAIKMQGGQPGHYLLLSPELQTMLNVPTNKITNDDRVQYTVNMPYFFNTLKETDKLSMSFIKPITTDFTLEEPLTYTMEGLMSNLRVALQSKFNIAISYNFVSEDGLMYLNLMIPQKSSVVKMPRRINKLFGMEENYEFKGTSSLTFTKYSVPSDLKQLENIPQQLIINSNIVKPCFIHDSMQSTLRVLLRKNIKEPSVVKTEPLLYQPLSVKHLDHISLSITDSYFNTIKTLNYPTTALIELRRRTLWKK